MGKEDVSKERCLKMIRDAFDNIDKIIDNKVLVNGEWVDFESDERMKELRAITKELFSEDSPTFEPNYG